MHNTIITGFGNEKNTTKCRLNPQHQNGAILVPFLRTKGGKSYQLVTSGKGWLSDQMQRKEIGFSSIKNPHRR